MKMTIIGGTGLVGSSLVDKLRQAGHDVRAASRSTGVDVITGEGLAQALKGTDVVVDVSGPGYGDAGDMQRFFETAGAHMLAAERMAGVGHHIVLSAIGTDRLAGSGYFRAKLAQEAAVKASGVPFTIVRSAPFFEFVYNIVDAGGDGDVIRLPPVRMQPIAADDVAKALARAAQSPPSESIIEIAGPDTYRLPQLAEMILTAHEDPRTVVTDEDALYFRARIGEEPLTGGAHPRFASTGFEDWLRHSLVVA